MAVAVAVGCELWPGCVFDPELVAEPVGEVAIEQQGEGEEREGRGERWRRKDRRGAGRGKGDETGGGRNERWKTRTLQTCCMMRAIFAVVAHGVRRPAT